MSLQKNRRGQIKDNCIIQKLLMKTDTLRKEISTVVNTTMLFPSVETPNTWDTRKSSAGNQGVRKLASHWMP